MLSLVLTGSTAFAEPPVNPNGWDPQLIVLATVDDLESARLEMERASYLLGSGIDEGSLRVPEAPRRAEFDVISVHRTSSGLLEIVCCVQEGITESYLDARIREHFPSARLRPAPDAVEAYYLQYARMGVIVAGSYRTYQAATDAARAVEKASGIPYGTRGLVYDEALGLHWPETPDSDSRHNFYRRRYDANCFYGRRYEAPCLTVEPSESYPGFEPGYYILVAGVLGRWPERDERLARVQQFVPDAYVKETNIWMGCIH